jgi:uncharacterized membrane protein
MHIHNVFVGCFVYSFAVSIKMNMLLYAPGIFLVLLMGTGLQETAICLRYVCMYIYIYIYIYICLRYVYCYYENSDNDDNDDNNYNNNNDNYYNDKSLL